MVVRAVAWRPLAPLPQVVYRRDGEVCKGADEPLHIERRRMDRHAPPLARILRKKGEHMSNQEGIRKQKGRLVGSPLASLEFTRRNFDNPALEWRRLFAEILGTFLLVLAAAGGGVVDAVSHGQISRAAEVTAPGLMVLAVILIKPEQGSEPTEEALCDRG